MRMDDLNKFEVHKNFIMDWEHVIRILEQETSPSNREILDRYFPKRLGGAGGSTTATNTVYDVKPNPKAGEQWWVKYPDQPRLVLIEVKEISGASVLIHVEGHHLLLGLRDGRYELDYFKFVEKYVPSLEPKPV